MDEFEISQEQFRANLDEFLRAIQTVRVVDAVAFQRVDREAAGLARSLKGRSLVPRSLLNELRVATKVLRAEAPYVEGAE